MWVGLRYRSKDGELHSLYIVAGEETTAKLVCYLSLVQFFLDHWRLRNPNAPLAVERRVRGVAALVAIVSVTVGAIVIR